MWTDAQTPFLGTPLVPLKVEGCVDAWMRGDVMSAAAITWIARACVEALPIPLERCTRNGAHCVL